MDKKFIIVIDSREQKKYDFPDVQTIIKTLKSGDYSVLGLEDCIAIERKSLTDAYNTFGRGRTRFEKELERLSKLQFAAVIIETSMIEALRNPPERSGFSPKCFNRAWIAWSQRYGVHFIFADNRELAQHQTYVILERFWRDIQEGNKK
jgi:DNA excision repair protein ERCC-4